MPVQFKPTHHCFDDALDFLEYKALSFSGTTEAIGRRLDGFVVVHGICVALDGHPYAHAWVEENMVSVWQGGLVSGKRVFFSVNRQEFYLRRRVQETTVYRWRRAIEENHRTNHYGPWKSKYAALCSKDTNAYDESPLGVTHVVSFEEHVK